MSFIRKIIKVKSINFNFFFSLRILHQLLDTQSELHSFVNANLCKLTSFVHFSARRPAHDPHLAVHAATRVHRVPPVSLSHPSRVLAHLVILVLPDPLDHPDITELPAARDLQDLPDPK